MSDVSRSARALIVGGSLGGLFAGSLLRRAGWDVDVFERAANDLDSRGGGIVLQPEVRDVFIALGLRAGEVGVRSRFRTVFRPDGSIESKSMAPQVQTSWSSIYQAIHGAFGESHYHRGKVLVGVARDTKSGAVTATFADGYQATGDLLIGADGHDSTVRRLLWPETAPSYAGYLAWRGLLPEATMPPSARADLLGDFGFASHRGSHVLGYLVPGADGDTHEGQRLYNWVWYRTASPDALERIMTDRDGRPRHFSIAEGRLADEWKVHLRREAAALLPAPFQAVVDVTIEPFAQAIRDLAVDTMVKGRVVLIGDAAFIVRPHTAASTSKAAADALALAAVLTKTSDVDRALVGWNVRQLELGRHLYAVGRRIGNSLLFPDALSP